MHTTDEWLTHAAGVLSGVADQISAMRMELLRPAVEKKKVHKATLNAALRMSVVIARRQSGETLKQIGIDMGITRERVRQLEKRALALMQIEQREMFLATRAARKPPPWAPRTPIKHALMTYFVEHPREPIVLGLIIDRVGLIDAAAEKARADHELQMLSGPDACQWLMDAYGLKWFGRYALCAHCEQILPMHNFMPGRAQPRAFGLCRSCNTARHRAWRTRTMMRARSIGGAA